MPVDQKHIKTIKEMWERGDARKDIAAALGYNEAQIYYVARTMGFERVNSPKQKVLIADSPGFRDMWESGVRTIDIARRYNVSTETIRRAALSHGYPRRQRGSCQVRLDAPEAPPHRAPEPEKPFGQFGNGTYAEIAAVAKARGWSLIKARQVFHRVGA